MMRLKYIFSFFSIIFLFFSLQSCINEDLTDCISEDNNIRIYIDYTISISDDLQRANSNKALAEHLQLFIFDDQGHYVTTLVDEYPDLNGEYYMSTVLPRGDYSFVAWGNLKEPYATNFSFIENESDLGHFNDALIYLICENNDSISTLLPHLFFGNLQQASIKSTGDQHFKIEIGQNTYQINLTVIGLEALEDTYNYTISDANISYGFDNAFMQENEVHYSANMTVDIEQQLVSSLNILELSRDDCHPMLKLSNKKTNQLLYQNDLVELILKLEEQGIRVDFTAMHEFDIVLTYDAKMNLNVSINGWDIIEDDSELQPSY